MKPIIIDGKHIAADSIARLVAQERPQGFIAAFVVGNDPATASFIVQKEKISRQLGIAFRTYVISSQKTQDQVRAYMRTIVQKKKCIGAILQLPLPAHMNPWYIANVIPPHKDIDVLSARSAGGFYNNHTPVLPPAISVLTRILSTHERDISSFQKAVIVGHGALVGKPVATWLGGKIPTVTVVDKGGDMNELHDADLVILGAGQPGLVRPDQCKAGAWVIDFGYGTDARTGKLCGDLLWDEKELSHLGLVTPTPGGTGPLLVASLFENLYTLYTDSI